MKVFGLVGNPVGHSLSPPMHNAAYAACDMDASYVTFEPTREDLDVAIRGARALGVSGLNVTIPFKQAVIDDGIIEPDSLAERIGAVNTIDFSDPEHPLGYNTDAIGAVRALQRHDVGLDGSTAIVVGAGGAGRAIVHGLIGAGVSVHVVNRTASKAVDLANPLSNVTGHGLDELDNVINDADILINATSVGMETDETPVPAGLIHQELTVMDIVYSPIETRLLSEANDRGAKTIDGAWMLLYQGAVAFERWTGEAAPIDAMNAALRQRL